MEEQVKRIAESARTYEPKEGKAENGDKVTIDFTGKIDGEPFEGGSATDSDLVLGSDQFIPGFEEQLIGLEAGDEKTIKVTFPDDYSVADLAGREATFDVTVKQVAQPWHAGAQRRTRQEPRPGIDGTAARDRAAADREPVTGR